MSDWNEKENDLLKLYADGASGGEIADGLNRIYGSALTRNAVIGKLHRMGLRRMDHAPLTRAVREATAQPRFPGEDVRSRGGNGATDHDPSLPEALAVPAPSDADIPLEQRRTVLELNSHTCRWPVGDPSSAGFFFCGAEPKADLPYCPHHCRIAYIPRQSKARPFVSGLMQGTR